MTPLRITLLGTPTVCIDEKPIFQENHTKAQALLYYLVVTGRTHYRSELASLFWPDVPDVQALKNLRNVLPVIRARAGEHFLITRHTVTFNRYTSYWLDIEAFESLLRIAPTQASITALQEAIALYDDDFLCGFYVRNAPLFEEWMLLKREQLRDMFIDALQTLATRYLQQQDYHAALKITRRLLNIAPWHENAHQRQMQALCGLGQRSTALAQYQICCRILSTEFNVPPNEETTRIYEQIKTAANNPDADAPSIDSAASDWCPHIYERTHGTSSSTAPDLLSHHVKGICPPFAISTDGQFIAVPDTDETIRLESLMHSCLYWLSGHSAAVTALSFSPDGRMLASASVDHTVRLWDTATGTLHMILSGHSAAVTALSFSPDGQMLASASVDQTVRLWDTATGTLQAVSQEHRYPVVHVTFVPDGTRLISVDTHRMVRFWNLQHSYTMHMNMVSVSD